MSTGRHTHAIHRLRIKLTQEVCQRGKPPFLKKIKIVRAQLLLDRRLGAQILRVGISFFEPRRFCG
jgi:hypothetical protein